MCWSKVWDGDEKMKENTDVSKIRLWYDKRVYWGDEGCVIHMHTA